MGDSGNKDNNLKQRTMNTDTVNNNPDKIFMNLNLHDKVKERTSCKILLIDDDEDDFVLTREMVKEIPGHEFELTWIHSYEPALEAMVSGAFDVFLIDYRLGKH